MTTQVKFSPYLVFSRQEWAKLRADTPLTLTEAEVRTLRGLNERIQIDEVVEIYLPVARLLNLYVENTYDLFLETQKFLGRNGTKVPFIIGMGGSVAVGKSTMARILQALLSRAPGHPHVALLPTDGFLFSNSVLEREGLMSRKGFPESYDVSMLLRFMHDVKSGKRHVRAPIYSHLSYDVLGTEWISIDQPDILIVEGLNVLQPAKHSRDGKSIPFVSDYFDFSIYLDADEHMLKDWYIERFFRLRETAFRDPRSYFHRYSTFSDEETRAVAIKLWDTINLVNLRENILPTRQRADLILTKGPDHRIHEVQLRRL
ncbi:type I pantothenate kinase [Rhodoligotrophos appendicifer]|uniref:type I pantothenate kinase n=1 Tax=Rhodoligotrophos appendicifer TaxID=987056 RepID=UPI0011803C24|nr:type I pantothenate kinase [Rhodoligotrophos appendicifer]